ncbi:Gfo/Idh/MocA family protein [Brevibacterium sp. UCMA 11754]|uniref:Gfo/Idh/MocA family protein n=1 Tax=Brevibacterium sp. UCMA 11754 TaxID=2749198 RepID=UPI001F46791B|nr:Gfo/Idh/MocA family oxidoreductase [Brevibacterium sp. UCMA 11754]MCF2571706.1 Gfo/Idh/MocA family oxidoreductase [Brevibacterium sp. UCMA 11754]
MTQRLGIAVIGAGMAGRAHASAWRAAPTAGTGELPELELVSVCDIAGDIAAATAARYGYSRHDTDWQAVVEADDIDIVSVVVANSLHQQIVEALLKAGKHVLCEKPLTDEVVDAESMVAAAESAASIARLGFTFRRAPGLAAIRDLIEDGTLGEVQHVNAWYWTDYACSPTAPMSWRYRGELGSGALADVGSHLTDTVEFLAGPIISVSGGRFHTAITSRPLPLGHVTGHDHVEVSDEHEPVGNDDYAGFGVEFPTGSGLLQVSRIAAGHPNSLGIEVFCANGSASFDFRNPGQIVLNRSFEGQAATGLTTVQLGPEHPYIADGLPMAAPGVGVGQNDGFTFQARAFLDEIAGIPEVGSLPRCAPFSDGLHALQVRDAVIASANDNGTAKEVN